MSMDSSSSSSSSGMLNSLSSGSQPPWSNMASSIFVAPYATIAVKFHVRMTLKWKHPNFKCWPPFFLSLCGKFSLHLHLMTLLRQALPICSGPSLTPASTIGSSRGRPNLRWVACAPSIASTSPPRRRRWSQWTTAGRLPALSP
jgi:hypothetical protein